MSLKAFHVFFIVVSVLLALWFAGWALLRYGKVDGGMNLAMALGSLMAAAVLVVYGKWFLRKLKDVQ